MKTTVWLTTSFVLFVIVAIAQRPVFNSPLHSMVATERAFAKASEEKGTRESFMMFIAEEGILFRPTPVVGKKWMQENPLPASDKRPLLSWQPTFADMAAAGDMGYTFGPWEYKEDIKDQKPVAYGHFATVWKKQADGTWKFAVDLGISHPQSATPATAWQPPSAGPTSRRIIPNVDVKASRIVLTNLDRVFSEVSAAQGTREAFLFYIADDVRIFRNDYLPFVGKGASAEALGANKGVLTWQPAAADVSRSGDLGYTYGLYELRANDAAKTLTGKGNYLRVWKKQGGAWKVVLDLANPLPLDEKKN